LHRLKGWWADQKKAPLDWCPSCKTVLANEQVIQGECERCDSKVIQKETLQWFLRITKYAEKLLKNLEKIDWSERTKIAQKNWIGRSEGAQIEFKIQNTQYKIPVFTTRPDTLFGCTYLVISPEHPMLQNIESRIKNIKDVKKYIMQSEKKSELERTELVKDKTGVELKGIKAVNPANKEEIPVFIADYVLASYGTGAIMAVPAHDQRDFEFAQKYSLPIKMVICPNYPKPICPVLDKAFLSEGFLVGSGKFNGMKSEIAKKEITKFVGGRKTVNYHLRDWLISRQRYWGPPIPIVYCKECGVVPVPESDLPVLLPFIKNFRPKGAGESPLASASNFIKTKCPKCGESARRETDVSDTFLDSSWYFFRYPSAEFKNKPFDENITKKWLPVDMYIGGQEHAVLHLLYTRFITMALKDAGFIDFEEPFKKFRAHGLLTKEGAKMSKSKGNVVNPDDYFKKFGADTLRMYLMFLGPFSEGGDWSDSGIMGIYRFLNKVWGLKDIIGNTDEDIEKIVQQTIKKVTEDIENLRYNTAISALMILANAMEKQERISVENYQLLLKLLAPFTPYIAEDLWWQSGNKNSIHNQKWPEYDEKLIKEDVITLVVQINGKLRDKIEVSAGISQKEAERLTLGQERIKQWILGKKIKKIIFIPNKLINIVI
jgi:leucyl-tRNA synthetase